MTHYDQLKQSSTLASILEVALSAFDSVLAQDSFFIESFESDRLPVLAACIFYLTDRSSSTYEEMVCEPNVHKLLCLEFNCFNKAFEFHGIDQKIGRRHPMMPLYKANTFSDRVNKVIEFLKANGY